MRGGEGEPLGVGLGVGGDFFEDRGGGRLGLPRPEAGGFRGVEHDPREIEGARGRIGGDGVRAELCVAPRGELAKGHRRRRAAGDVGEAIGGGELGRGELLFEERDEIARVEAVADLVAVAAEADIFERAAAQVGVEPVGEDALVGAAELAGTGEDPAAVHEDGKAEGFAVFEGEGFAGEFGGTVKGDGGGGGECLVDAGGAEADRKRRRRDRERARGRDRTEGVGVGLYGERGERRDRVDATGAEENETGAVGFAVFEEVDRAGEVVFDELAGAGFSVDAGEDAGVGGGVDNPVDARKRFEVAGGAEIGVDDFYAEFFEFGAVGLAAGTDEVVEAVELVTGTGTGEGAGEGAADEAADAGDENAHEAKGLRGLRRVGRGILR